MGINYKENVKRKLYNNYFTNLHASEEGLEFTSTKIANKDILNNFRDYFRTNHNRVILDAGCGDGLFMKDALDFGFKCEGFDINHDLLKSCKAKGYKVKYADIQQKLPYKDGTFDGIFCSNIFEHIPEPEFALYELLRVLKKGGKLIITVPEADNKAFYNDWTHITPFTKNTLKNLMTCVEDTEYKIYKRHFAVLVKYMDAFIIKFGNWLIKNGPLAEIFTWVFEKLTYTHRHDLVLEINK